jgi:hypothetical protein
VSEPLPYGGVTHESFFGWFERRKDTPQDQPVAQLVATPRGAVLRLRNADPGLEQKVIRGKNPLTFDSINGARVLAVDPFLSRVFVVVEHATMAIAERVARSAFAVLPSSEYQVYIREDEWFVPDLNPSFNFFSVRQPPAFDEWQKAPNVWCAVTGKDVKCRPLITTAGRE